MRVAAELIVDHRFDERKSDRRPSGAGAALGGEGRLKVQVRIVDISSQGCRLELSGPLPEGALVSVKVPTFEPWQARIVWSKRGTAGCQFTHLLHPAVVQRLTGAFSPDTR